MGLRLERKVVVVALSGLEAEEGFRGLEIISVISR